MTSRHISERTAETRRPTLRRGIRKRSILPSFGDIVLPIVSVAAVGLLVLAGRQFFLNGMQTSPSITSAKAYADAPALIAEREKEQEILPPVQTQTPEPEENMLAVAEPVSEPVTPEPPKALTAPAPKKTAPAKKPPAKATSLPASKQWRVQIGAYGSKAAAQEAANKITKSGYKATVYSNPASKHYKVWVQGGADKASAERVVNAMKKLGYKGSFSFPPAK